MSRTFVQKKHGHRVSPASRQGDLWRSALVKERQKEREREREREAGAWRLPGNPHKREREKEAALPARGEDSLLPGLLTTTHEELEREKAPGPGARGPSIVRGTMSAKTTKAAKMERRLAAGLETPGRESC